MRIKFWGVRGSIPCPGPYTARYGGNTSCIELRLDSINRLVIIDAGSGIRELGDYLIASDRKNGPICADIFLTHTHWDHIMGFPFFTPIYMPDSRFKIYGPVTYEDERLKNILGGQWTYRYFPVRHEELRSDIEYIDLKEGMYDLGQGLRVRTKYLNHPLLCLGYRFEFQGKVFCTCYDTEPFANVFTTDVNDPAYDAIMAEEGEKAAAEENKRIEQFIHGADLLIYDTQYTSAEYHQSRIGWGHSPIEFAIDSAKRNNVKRLALFHHDVQRSDMQLETLTRELCAGKEGEGTEIFFARERMQITI
jgi:phosphoribosyl 1,2-cyclic phosphodiesterase